MDSSVSLKDEIWFLRVCHHISNAVYLKYVGPFQTHLVSFIYNFSTFVGVSYRYLYRAFFKVICLKICNNMRHKKKLRGLNLRANYTDRAAAAGRRS